MTQKTALMLMIEMIESVRRDEPPTALWNLKKYAQELLATEKQQIIGTYKYALPANISEAQKQDEAEFYYNQTYGQ